MRPHVTRAEGREPSLDAASGRLALAITLRRVRLPDDLRANGAVSILLAQPSDYRAMQIVGVLSTPSTPHNTDSSLSTRPR